MPVLDIHAHTARYSPCSTLDPDGLCREARLRGLDGIVITEHGKVWTDDELTELGRNHPGLLILAAQEVTTWEGGRTRGDILVFGPRGPFPRMTPEALVEAVRAAGGAAVAAHPFRRGLGLEERIRELSLDALEVLNGNASPEENRLAAEAALELKLPALGGSDAHHPGRIVRYATEFEGKVESLRDIISLIREGKCRAVNR
jgi:predicted metal-dependent phosphoesterase TrpH